MKSAIRDCRQRWRAGRRAIAGRYGHGRFSLGQSRNRYSAELTRQRHRDRQRAVRQQTSVSRSGDILKLPLGGRDVPFRVVGIYYDYSNERGFIIMDRGTLLKYLPDRSRSNIAVYLKSGMSARRRQAGRGSGAGRPEGAGVFEPHLCANEAMRIFDRTFAHHLRARSRGSVRRNHGRGRRAAGSGDRSPPRVRLVAIPGRQRAASCGG